MKTLIFDSGTLINLSMNGLLYILEGLKKSNVTLAITHEVKYELVERPIKVPRFELGALRIQSLIDNKTLELPESLGVSNEEIKSETKRLMEIANTSVKSKGKIIKIVSEAEISCLALSTLLTKKGIENIIGIDERTTRILAEKPSNLQKIMTRKLHSEVQILNKELKAFSQFKFIRSTELVLVAYKKGLLNVKGPKALEAVLYATKFKGSSVSWDELKILRKL